MLNNRIILWCATLLSALLFSTAFFVPDQLGFLVIGSLVLLFLVLGNTTSCKQALGFGFVWGVVVYGLHFLWLYILFMTKSEAGPILSIIFYLLIVLYFSVTSGLWFLVTVGMQRGSRRFFSFYLENSLLRTDKKIVRSKKQPNACFLKSLPIISTILYFLFLDYVALWWIGSLEGYPFLSPFIPLARYKIFLGSLSFCSLLIHDPRLIFNRFQSVQTAAYTIVFIKPPVKTKYPSEAGQRLFHTIDRVLLHMNRASNFLFVAPESTFPHPLNRYTEVVSLLGNIMPAGSCFLLGTHVENDDGKLYQAVCWIEGGRIKNTYVKKHLIPFVEKMPPFFKKYSILKNIFLRDLKEFSTTPLATASNFFYDASGYTMIPQICSEFFFKGRRFGNTTKTTVFLFINDSWFVDYFRKILENLTYVKSATIGLPIVLIGHFVCKEISAQF